MRSIAQSMAIAQEVALIFDDASAKGREWFDSTGFSVIRRSQRIVLGRLGRNKRYYLRLMTDPERHQHRLEQRRRWWRLKFPPRRCADCGIELDSRKQIRCPIHLRAHKLELAAARTKRQRAKAPDKFRAAARAWYRRKLERDPDYNRRAGARRRARPEYREKARAWDRAAALRVKADPALLEHVRALARQHQRRYRARQHQHLSRDAA